MIVIRTYGGLGNQLFQYAIGKALSQKHKLPLYLDIHWFNKKFAKNITPRVFTLGDFKCNSQTASLREYYGYYISKYMHIGKPYITEKEQFTFDTTLFEKAKHGAYLDGYWQHEKYFSEIRPLLLKELVLNESLSKDPSYVSYSNKIKSTHNSVSLHVRRTDYIGLPGIDHICDLAYYKRAMLEISKKIENPTFFVFSDDIAWTKENLPKEYTYEFVEANTKHPAIDMILMSNCSAHIIANSTFSWWGAWLDPKPHALVIGPTTWNGRFPGKNLMLDQWQKI